jgi:hypothetical protein
MTLSLVTAEVAQVVAAALFLSFLAERLVEYFSSPLFSRYAPDHAWLQMYLVAVVGGALSYLAQINLFGGVFPSELAGVAATALVIGGGSEFVHQILGAMGRTNRE